MELATRVVETIARAQRMDPSRISTEASFDELGFDSLDALTIAFALEEEFAITIPEEAIHTTKTMPELIRSIAERVETTAG